MTLGRLTRLGRSELEKEMAKLRETIAELEAILADPAKLRAVIAAELGAIKQQHSQPRRTRVIHDPGEMGVEDLIDDEEIVVTMTRAGYMKAVPADAFRDPGPRRAGRPGGEAEGGGPHRPGRAHHGPLPPPAVLQPGEGLPPAGATRFPMKERNARGTPIVNLLPLAPDESIQAIVDTRTSILTSSWSSPPSPGR